MSSMQGFGSRRLMANPCTGDKCANATAAMRARVRPMSCRDAPRMRGITRRYGSTMIKHGLLDHPLEPVIGLAGGETRMTPCNFSSRFRSLRLAGRTFLAFGHELLALLAVDALGIGFL